MVLAESTCDSSTSQRWLRQGKRIAMSTRLGVTGHRDLTTRTVEMVTAAFHKHIGQCGDDVIGVSCVAEGRISSSPGRCSNTAGSSTSSCRHGIIATIARTRPSSTA